MNIQSLSSAVYEDSDGLLTAQKTLPDGSLQLEFECNDWNGTHKRRRFEFRCEGIEEARIDLGYVGAISLHDEHPLLLKHQGQQAELYFSTAPTSPEVVFTEASIALQTELQGWREPSECLHGSPEVVLSNLKAGHGLLARGPKRTLITLRDALNQHLKLQLVDSYVAKGHCLALIIECSWVVCTRVTVHEHDA